MKHFIIVWYDINNPEHSFDSNIRQGIIKCIPSYYICKERGNFIMIRTDEDISENDLICMVNNFYDNSPQYRKKLEIYIKKIADCHNSFYA